MEKQSSDQNKKNWKQRALALGLGGALVILGAAVGLTGCDNPDVAAQPGTEQPGASGNEDIGPESGMDNYQNGGDGEEQGD
ncbi:MAG: hypothetical protein LBC23_04710, partial [Coriobacteriales bacterium]|nr:hypothetical protein [Coriobacteriales bacterium]